jgi:hypothetical protein
MQPSGTPQAIYLLLTLATWRGEQRRSRLRQEAGAPQPAPTSGCNYVRPDRHQLTATRTRDTPARPPSHSPGPPASSSAHPSSPAARPGKPAGQRANAGKCTLSSAANVKPHTHPPQTLSVARPSLRTLSVAVRPRADPVRGRPCTADGPPHRSLAPIPVRPVQNRRSPIGLTRAGLYLPRDPSPTGRIINDCVVRSFQEVAQRSIGSLR